VWSQRVAHGSAPNDSPNARFAQFFKVVGGIRGCNGCSSLVHLRSERREWNGELPS
jgi:hypothetical protein